MPDTPENQAEYPQPESQKRGVGFPILRILVLLSLATGMVLDAAFGPYSGKETGETALFRKLWDSLPPNSLLIADRIYCCYWLIALAKERGHDVVFRLHGQRSSDFRQGKPLGPNDRQIVWERPERPQWMTPEEYARLPLTLTLRMLRTTETPPGFRASELTVVTTLAADEYAAADVMALYRQRWNVELDIRAIKAKMQMDVLTCKTPENVRREIWIKLLAYNLCREQGGRAAHVGGTRPREISLAACLQAMQIQSSQPPCFWTPPASTTGAVSLARQLANERVGDRPDRIEPRAIKRRPKPHALLHEPRDVARKRLRNGAAA